MPLAHKNVFTLSNLILRIFLSFSPPRYYIPYTDESGFVCSFAFTEPRELGNGVLYHVHVPDTVSFNVLLETIILRPQLSLMAQDGTQQYQRCSQHTVLYPRA